jgi:predicted transcriptional regulator
MEVAELASTQDVLLAHITRAPGVRYRELLRLTGLANGVLTYHLAAIEKSGMVRVERKSRTTRYYPLSVSEDESYLLGFIRHKPMREIVSFILANDMCTFSEIVDDADKSPSTVSSHLKRLKEADIVQVRYGEYQLYSLTNRELVANILSKYKPTFADQVVDNYVEMLDEL